MHPKMKLMKFKKEFFLIINVGAKTEFGMKMLEDSLMTALKAWIAYHSTVRGKSAVIDFKMLKKGA